MGINGELIQASKGMKYGISIAMKLSDSIIDSITDHPHRLYMHHYQTINKYLDTATLLIGNRIEKMGGNYIAVPTSLFLKKRNDNTSHLSHRWVALNAGLGWIGRNNLLINPKYGPRIRLTTILTDLPLKNDIPIEFACGDCYDCVEACPANALGEKAEDYNLGKCDALLSYFIGKYNVGHKICGVCIKACPIGRNNDKEG